MSKLLKMNIDKFLFFDAEVVREHETLEIGSDACDVWKRKHRSKDLQPHELIDLYEKEASLDPCHSKIVCITVGFVTGGKIHLKSLVGDEKTIISDFCDILEKLKVPCGFNILDFDLPLLLMRAFKHGLSKRIPDAYNVSGKKPWDFDNTIVDLMKSIKGTMFKNPSLADCCYLMGVESPKTSIDGSMVSDAYYAGRLDEIVAYCERDVLALVHLFQRMNDETELITEIVVKTDGGVKEEVIPEMSLLERIYRSSDLSDKTCEEIKTLIGKKKLTVKDKKNLKTILMGIMIHTDFVNKDQTPKADKERIEAEIDGFISGLK